MSLIRNLILQLLFTTAFLSYSESAFAVPKSFNIASGNWNTPGNWTPSGVPGSSDAVTIPAGSAVTVDVVAFCNTLTFGNASNTACSLTISGSNSLTVTGAITYVVPAGNTNDQTISVGAGTVSCSSIVYANTGNGNQDNNLNVSTGTVNVTGNITFNGAASENAFTISGAATLNIGGTVSGSGTFTVNATGALVNYNGTTQTIKVTTYTNLTLSGTGGKTFPTGTTTVNGILSVENGANANTFTGTLAYGTNATLQYNTSSARAAATEWITPFAATGGVIIKNSGAITLNAAKVFNADIPLNIEPGATLTPGSNLLTLGGNFTNGGTFTSGSGGITITGIATTQNIDGFTTTGNVSMTKTTGTATITGAASAVNLSVNGSGGTLILSGANTFSGTRTLTIGTLTLANTDALGASGTSLSLNGGTIILATDASVNAYNTTVNGTVTIVSDRASSGAGITHTLGTLSIGSADQLNVTVGSNVASGTAGLTFGNTTLSAATPIFDVATGANLTLGAVSGNFAFTKQNTGQITLSSASSRSAGVTTLTAGTMVLENVSALGTTATSLTLNGGSLILSTDATVNAYNTTVNGTVTIASGRATSGAGVTHTLGTLSIGTADLLNVTVGGNVSSGNAGLAFGNTTLSAATPIFDVATGANLTLGAISGNFAFTKQNNGQLTLNSSSGRTSGTVTLTAGTLQLGSVSAIGTTGVALQLNGGNLDLETDATINAYNTTINGAVTIASGRATSGAAVTHTLGTLSIGTADQLNVTVGNNVTSGTAGLTFGNTTLSAATPVFDVANGANLTLGAISGNFAFTKQNSGQLTLNNASARTSGTVTLTAGTLQLGSVSALGTTGVALALNGGTLDLETDATVNAYNATVNGAVTVASGRATSGVAITHVLGTLSIGTADQLNVTVGNNVTSGTAGLTFGNTTLSAATPVFDVATGANLRLGALTGNFAFTKQNSGLLTLNNASGRTSGTVTLTDGTLQLGSVSALGTTGVALQLNGGTLDLAISSTVNAYNTTVGGNTTINSNTATAVAGITHILGTLSIGANTLTINKGSNATGATAAVRFGNTTLTGAATLSPETANLIITGTESGAFKLNKSGGGTLQKTSSSWTLAGDFEITAGTYDANALTTTVTGLTTVSGGIYTANSAAQTFNGGLIISGGTYTGLSGTAGNTSTTNLTLSSGSLSTPGSTGTFNISGNVNITGGTFSHNSGTVNLNGTTQTISSTAAFNNLTCSNSDTKTMTSGITLSGSLTISGTSKLAIGANTLTLNGNFSGSSSNCLVGDGSNSIVSIGGSGAIGNLFFDQTTAGTTNRIKDFTLNRSGQTLTLGNSLELIGTLTLSNGTFASAGFLTLVSNSSGTARIGQITGTGAISGNVTAQRFIPGGNSYDRAYRFLASPVSGQTFAASWQQDIHITGPGSGGTTCPSLTQHTNGFDANHTTTASIYTYNETTGAWASIANTNATNLSSTTAYRVFVRGNRNQGCGLLQPPYATAQNTTLKASGTITTGQVNISLTKATSGWNLVPNPYHSAIDWNNATWVSARSGNIGSTIYIWNPVFGVAGQYASWNPIGGSVNGGSNIIQSGQSFFINTSAAATLTFEETYKSTDQTTQLFGKTALSQNLKIQLSDTSLLDEAVIFTFAGCNHHRDAFDGIKLSFGNGSIATLTKVNPEALTFNGIEPFAHLIADTILLKTGLQSNKSYNLNFIGTASFNRLNAIVYLYDNYLNTSSNITLNPYYSFTSNTDTASFSSNRFFIIFASPSALPVTLSSFDVLKTESAAVKISWTTSSEMNNSHFVVEKSINNFDYSEIALIKSRGNSSTNNIYAVIDDKPYTDALNYYRLKQIDIDGEVTYSGIRSVDFGSSKNSAIEVSLYPNPIVDENLTFSLSTKQQKDIMVTITDLNGNNIIDHINLNSSDSKYTISCQNMNSGVYFLQVNLPDGNICRMKFVK